MVDTMFAHVQMKRGIQQTLCPSLLLPRPHPVTPPPSCGQQDY